MLPGVTYSVIKIIYLLIKLLHRLLIVPSYFLSFVSSVDKIFYILTKNVSVFTNDGLLTCNCFLEL